MGKVKIVISRINDANIIMNNCIKTSVENKDKSYKRELSILVVNKITNLISNKVLHVDADVSSRLNTTVNCFKTLITNRVPKVLRLMENSQWTYVPSTLNVANFISCGLGSCDLPKLKLNEECYPQDNQAYS
ncbi:hypothetical protein TNCT_471421 [Trichonephila clavata]|uniref:Uncharacterized protein n=1 Tax=Trichonephila clavata TaxID=2740835 RepID=A0A8X6LSR1_TRICU|nr:hypothetical protein TNCT_471421 [Trichonephila clavata]